MRYEYKVMPAPKAGLKGKGIKTAEDRFANALATAMNILGAEGWEYQRTDTLPVSQREGLMGKATVFQNMMIFRRVLAEDATLVAVDAPPNDIDESNTPEPEVTPQDEPAEVTEITEDLEDASASNRLNLDRERV